jgi:formylglycine-generating enzyme required for sulfatase activity
MPRVTPASVPPPPARPAVSPPAEAATPSPPIEAAVSSRPPRANGAVARESKPTDSWRYASAGPVDPPRRAVTLPVPAESIIVESVDLDDRTQPRGQAIAPHEILQPPHILMPQSSVANASAPPSVRQVPTIPPGASMPPRQVTSDFPVPSRSAAPRSHVVPVTLALVAFAGLAAGGFVLLGRRASSHDRAPPAARAAVSAVVAPAAPSEAPAVAPPVVAPAARPRCPEGMVLIEGGLFMMGSDAPDAIAAVKPAHPVTVATFCIDALEVSVARFKACSDAGECKRGLLTNEWAGISTLERVAYEPMCNLRDPVGLAAHPINCVDWERADIYCTAHGSRLPTEAEWELAARGRDNRSYPWGNEPPAASLLNACGPECATWATKNGLDALAPLYDVTDGWLGTAPGRTFPAGATPEGVADLAGNVAEWVADAYAPYTSTSQTSPVVTSGDARVVRGGSFVSGKLAAISPTYRTREKITKRSSTLGFRCAGAPVAAAGK